VDDLIRIHDVAGFAMNAVGGVDLQSERSVSLPRIGHFIDGGRTEKLAGITIFVGAAGIANVGLQHDEMAWLIFVVLRSGVIYVRQLVKGELSIERRRSRRRHFAVVILL